MILGTFLGNNFGAHAGTWRMPHVDPHAYTSIEATIAQARAAERGGLSFVFMPERLFLAGELATSPPIFNIDPLITLAALSQATEKIGLIGTASTSFSEPYLLARQLKALDIVSHGRAGWNAVPSFEPAAFASFGREVPAREDKYERLHEVMQVVHALWGSWEHEAGQPDQASGRYADPDHVRPVNLRGTHVGAGGPLPIPPSEQGHPVVVQPASSGLGLQAAGMYANVVIGMPSSIEDGQAQRATVRQAAALAGRAPDEVKYLAFASFTIGASPRAALDMRRALDDRIDLRGPLPGLAAHLGLRDAITQPDEPFPAEQLNTMRAHPGNVRSERAVALARAGWSARDILAHAVLDPTPTVVGTADQGADHLQQWYEAEAADGFVTGFDDYSTGIDDFVDGVIPVLRQRGLVADGYEGTTLRENLGLPAQYGLDLRTH
jgi:FMN-dependent oxidoreductase (nitrilotriacetate monooxygenase family)